MLIEVAFPALPSDMTHPAGEARRHVATQCWSAATASWWGQTSAEDHRTPQLAQSNPELMNPQPPIMASPAWPQLRRIESNVFFNLYVWESKSLSRI